MSLRDAILAVTDAKVVKLHVPEWGVDVHLRVMSGGERDAFEAAIAPDPKSGKRSLLHVRARFAAIVLADETGKRLFTDADIQALSAKSSTALDLIFDTGMKHNAMLDSDVEDLAGKSASGQSGDSGTR